MTTNRLERISTGLILALIFIVPVSAVGQSVPIEFRWTAPVDGAPVDHYVVYASRDDEEFRFEGTESDTTFVLQVELGVEYRIRVSGISAAGLEGETSLSSEVAFLPVPQPEDGGPPPQADLKSNYPNPFNPETTIRYGVPENLSSGARVTLELFDVRGQRVRSFPVNRTPGWHEAVWNGRNDLGDLQPSGHYVVRLVADGRISTWKMTMVK